MMTDRSVEIDEIRKSIDRERTNLLTVIAAVSFLCVCLFVSNIAVSAITVSAFNERDAVSIALDDQRTQYYRCLRDEEFTEDCDQDLISPPSRDIQRDLEAAGFGDVLYAGADSVDEPPDEEMEEPRRPQVFGVLGRIIY